MSVAPKIDVIYPPHPKSNMRIMPHRLFRYEKRGNYLAQLKFNGIHVVVCITENRNVYILTRHGEPTKRFKLTEAHIKEFQSLNLEEGKK